MKPTSELFDLIKSLTPSEKRYFKLNVSLQKGSKNYLKLFDALDSQKIFSENEIKMKYKKESFVKNLTFTKNYLYKLIFRSLTSYANEKSIGSKLNNILNRCRFLFEKSLFREYFKTVQTGKEMARKYEMFSYLLEFLEIERQLTKKEDIGKINMNNIYDEELNVIEKIKNINSYKRAVSDLLKINISEGIVRSKAADERINQIISGRQFRNENEALSLIAKERFYFSMYLASRIKGSFKESLDYNRKRVSLISGNKKIFQKFMFDNYKESYLTLINSASLAGKFDEALDLHETYCRVFSKPGNTGIDGFIAYYEFRLLELIINEKSEPENNLISSIEKILIRYKDKITIDSYNIIYYNLSRYFFIRENFTESLRLMNVLFDSRYQKHTPNLEPYMRLLNILIHYELGNYGLLAHLVPAAEKYLKSRNRLFRTEKLVLSFLKKIIKTKTNQQARENFLTLNKELTILKKNKFEKNAFEYFDFSKWVMKKIISIKLN